MIMPDDHIRRAEVSAGIAGRRCRPARGKSRITGGSLAPEESVSAAARRDGVAPNPPFRRRRLTDEGDAMAAGSDGPVVGACEVRRPEGRVRDLGRRLGRETMETGVPREAPVKSTVYPATMASRPILP